MPTTAAPNAADSKTNPQAEYRLFGGDFPRTMYDRLRDREWGTEDPERPTVITDLFDDIDDIDDGFII